MMYILTGIIFLMVGLANYKFPEVACYIKEEWKFREVEPSDRRMRAVKFAGICLGVFGIVMIVYGLL